MKYLKLLTCLALFGVSLTNAATLSQTVNYWPFSQPQTILSQPQVWEGDQQPHTLAVLELNRDGYKYWGYYGLNEGRGIGLARSNDLKNWVKHPANPLLTNARWPSVIANADSSNPQRIYLATTRDYDSNQSHIELFSSDDGIQLKSIKILVKKQSAPSNRNQNPNLFLDPQSKNYVLSFYRGNDNDHFEIVSRVASKITDLDQAADHIVLNSKQILAAPSLAYVNKMYFLTTEVFAGTYPNGKWQTKAYYSKNLLTDYQPVSNNPILSNDQACLFQHFFNGKYYGFLSRLESASGKWLMEVVEGL